MPSTLSSSRSMHMPSHGCVIIMPAISRLRGSRPPHRSMLYAASRYICAQWSCMAHFCSRLLPYRRLPFRAQRFANSRAGTGWMSNGVRSEGSPMNNALEASLTKSYNHTVMPYLRTTDAVPFMNRRHSVIRSPIRDGGPAAATVYVISQDKQPVVQRIPPFGMGAGLTHGLGGPAAATVYVISQDKQPVVQRIPPFGMGAGLTHRLGRGQLTETPFQTVDRLQESDGVHCQNSHDVPFAAPYATAGRSGRSARTGHSGTPRSALPQAFGNLWICG